MTSVYVAYCEKRATSGGWRQLPRPFFNIDKHGLMLKRAGRHYKPLLAEDGAASRHWSKYGETFNFAAWSVLKDRFGSLAKTNYLWK